MSSTPTAQADALRHRANGNGTGNGNGKPVGPTEEGKKTDRLLDSHLE